MKNAERRTADTRAAEITRTAAPEKFTQFENAAKIARAKANIIQWANNTTTTHSRHHDSAADQSRTRFIYAAAIGDGLRRRS